MLAQERRVRQGNEAVLGPLAPVDMPPHLAAVDVGDLKMLGFLQAQTAGVDGGEEGIAVRGVHAA